MRFNILVVPYMLARGERVALAGSDPARFQQLMHRVRDQMQFAEQLGYSGFCMTEQHMQILTVCILIHMQPMMCLLRTETFLLKKH